MADSDSKFPGRRRVGKGGVALLWHRRIDYKITPLSIDDDRIVGLQYEITPSAYVCVFQVYFPCSNHPMARFNDYVNKLSNLLGLYSDKEIVIIMGDLNTSILNNSSQTQSTRSRHLIDFMNTNNFVSVNTMDFCTVASSTFMSYDSSCETCIDQILFPSEQLYRVHTREISDDGA